MHTDAHGWEPHRLSVSIRGNPWLKLGCSAFLLTALWGLRVPNDPALSLCGFHWLTGRLCPLCGLTRGLFAFGKGQWSAALHFNALTPLAFAMLFSLFWSGPWRNRLWTAGMAAFAAYGVVRVCWP